MNGLNHTLIEWVRNPDGTQGYTWNPITGCLNHTPDGLCKGGLFPCYAWESAHTRLEKLYLSNGNYAPMTVADINDPFYPRFWEDRLDKLDPSRKLKHFTVGGGSCVQPKGIFVCDMSDLFGIGIPDKWTKQVLHIIAMNPGHRFYLLTKQPQNLPSWSPFPLNVYLGVSVTNQEVFDKAIYYLEMVDAKVKFLSFEPLLIHKSLYFFLQKRTR